MQKKYHVTPEGLLSRLEQPALIVKDETVLYRNEAAEKLLCGMEPILQESMLPETLEMYRSFSGEGALVLDMRLGGTGCSFTVCRENGTDIFLAAAFGAGGSYSILERTSQAIRRSIHDINDELNARLPDLKLYDDPAVKNFIARTSKAVCQMNRLAGNLSDYSGLCTGRLSGRFESIELVKYFDELCGQIQRMFTHCEITFTSSDKTMMGQVNRSLLERAVLNLVSNSLRSTGAAGTLRVELLRLPRRKAALRVSDNGSGMDAASVSTAMHAAGIPLSPLENPELGVGLGLSLCMEIARLHGGTLVLQSVPGKGTLATLSFSLSLPIEKREQKLECSTMDGLNPLLVELSDRLPASAFYDMT